jgi:transposase InsO family protein
MSRRGDCYDNSCAESFFHTLKVELTHGVRYETRAQLRHEVFEFIEAYYNTNRRHSTLGFISPVDFEALKVA